MGGLGSSAQRHDLIGLRSTRPDGTDGAGPSRDAIPPPVDSDHQEVLEDGEVHDMDESYQDGEDMEAYAPSSSSSMVPEPEMIAYWESSLPTFSKAPGFRPMSSASGKVKKWSHEATPAFAPPSMEPFAHPLFNKFRAASKASFDSAQQTMSTSGAAGHAIAYAAVRLEAMKSQLIPADATPEEKEAAAPWERCCDAISAALKDATRILACNYTQGLMDARKGAEKFASQHVADLIKEKPPSGGYYFGNCQKEVVDTAKFVAAEANVAHAFRPPTPRVPRRYGLPRGAARASAAAPAASSSSSSSSQSASSNSSKRGKGYGRSSRGGKGGQKKS